MEKDVEYISDGGDIHIMTLIWQHCQTVCKNREGCKAWTFNPIPHRRKRRLASYETEGEGSNYQRHGCFIKEGQNVLRKVVREGAVSALNPCPDEGIQCLRYLVIILIMLLSKLFHFRQHSKSTIQ